MENKKEQIEEFLSKSLDRLEINENFKKLGINFNPFPRAGISDINSSEYILGKLIPIEPIIENEILKFISDSLYSENINSDDKYLSLVIRGDYGNGKTQTLLYIKYILERISSIPRLNKKPYIVYIDNPGAKLSELIGSIITQIGEESFKKYLWDILISKILKDDIFKGELTEITNSFLYNASELFNENNLVSHKGFLNNILEKLPQKQRTKVQDLIKTKSIQIFNTKFLNSTIATYFYNLLSEDLGVNKVWELLSSGSARELEKKEVYIIKAIVDLIELNGFTDFFILVDEFEDVTVGRLTGPEIDRYITNLRALIDKERNWCSVFAMTGQALSKLKSMSPPLADRISSRLIDLKGLDEESAKKIIINYLNLVREESNAISPFAESGIKELINISYGNLRLFLKDCFDLLQRISENYKKEIYIDSEFVKKHARKTKE